MFFPQAMIRLVWFVPEVRLASCLECLSETGQFHPVDRLLLGDQHHFAALRCLIQSESANKCQQIEHLLLEKLPDAPLLNYRVGQLSPSLSLPEESVVKWDGVFLWAGMDLPAQLESRKSRSVSEPNAARDVAWNINQGLTKQLTQKQRQLLFRTERQIGQAGGWCVIDGWIPASQEKRFCDLLQHESILMIPAEQSDIPLSQVPSLFRRPRMLDGFAALMELYGTSAYRELDPIPVLAIGFTLMFGVMFADLGQGFLLFLFGLWFYSKRLPFFKPQTCRNVGCLLIPIGLSAIFFGALFGSAFAHEDWIPALLFHPMDHVLLYLSFSVLFGVLLICIGMLIGLLNAWRKRQFNTVLWDNFGPVGFGFYLALIALGLGTFAQWPLLSSLGLTAAAIALSAMAAHYFLTKSNETLGLRLFACILETYDFALKFVVQTFSFVRIAAFTFAHIALSTALIISVEMFDKSPLLAWGTLILGNLLITVIEGALVCVQAIRLHFFELFSKFASGGGVAFSPLIIPEETWNEYNSLA